APAASTQNFGTGSFSINTWFRSTVQNTGSFRYLVQKYVPAGGYGGYAMYINFADKLTFSYFSPGNSEQVSGGPALTDGSWHMLTAVVSREPNASASANLFID